MRRHPRHTVVMRRADRRATGMGCGSLVLLLSVLLSAVGSAAPPEQFTYVTYRAGDKTREPVEHVTMVTTTSSNRIETVYTSAHQGGSETTRVSMRPDGSLVEATHRDVSPKGVEKSNGRIWLDDGRVHAMKMWPSGKRTVRSKAHGSEDVVADAGLLQFLRLFPFDQASTNSVMIASFRQHFVVMELEQTARETVNVPAGTFDCFRVDGTIDLVIKAIRTTYWVTQDTPHFLVRFEGKRGLFLAPTFITELTGVQVRSDEP